MTLHEIDKEIESLLTQEAKVVRATSRPYDEETKQTLKLLRQATLSLENRWWHQVRTYTGVSI